ncbi:MAG: response regulator [Gemmatimonadetes bacterium]|nr:response regulator [Gemmatimonadota bacterium]
MFRSPLPFVEAYLVESSRALGTETVLLVEDDTAVRAVAHKALLRLGYTVLSAEGGEDALRLARDYQGRIHLLLTDVMMPGMNGLVVASKVTRFRPGIRIFFMSGYADRDLVRQGLLDPETHLLEKPFSPQELGERVREILDLPSKS